MEPPAGLEPAIYRLEVCRLIHWATGAGMLAEDGFDPSTSGLWAQRASTAPLCFCFKMLC